MGSRRSIARSYMSIRNCISFLDMPVNSSNMVTKEGSELGRFLFYDPILSADSSLSCAGCHRQEVAFSDAPNRKSKGIGGQLTKRNAPGLFNLAWHPSLFWDGRSPNVEDQVFHPVREHGEMNLQWPEAESRIRNSEFYTEKFQTAFGTTAIDSVLIANAIAQFERTIISNGSKYDRVLKGEAFFTKDEYKGFELMNDMTKGDCLHCHTTDGNAVGSTFEFSDNGLDAVKESSGYSDEGRGGVNGNGKDNGKFKIPSLKNVALTPPYMHDGRFNTLKEVLDFYSDGVNESVNVDSKMGQAHLGGMKLSEAEKMNIISFLNTLSDSSLISNPEYSNPFTKK